MERIWKTILWQQFGAAMDMLEKAMVSCPDKLWHVRLWNDPAVPPVASEFWYVAYHTLFWLDLYLTGSVEGFAPPVPYTLAELDPAGLYPEQTYTREELLGYLEHNRQKCQVTVMALTDTEALQTCTFPWGEITFAELQLDNIRHVQEHAAQLNLILGQKIGAHPGWVARHRPEA